ncbi:MAG: pyridoxal phosphate-dependent aminotransferase [Eggerthellaceae bacterium]|nr:pyridoxal phosphate-dependent aminotransferase [Eggerthellaceae bacterium]
MINERMLGLGKQPNPIRVQFAYGLQRKAEIGEENVYDLSIGNPSIPAPPEVRARIEELLQEPPQQLHAYSMAAGLMNARQAIADNLRERFGIPATAANVYFTAGATAALYITTAAITHPGDEVIVNAPYFTEYKVMIETAQCTCVEVPMRQTDFQLDIDALREAINEKTAAVVINSPNNPVGCIYTQQNIEELAAMLSAKEEELGHPIYLISDEPYREITYGKEVPFTANFYRDTIVCYSWAKSLSLPGERIGYIYVSDNMPDAADVSAAVGGAGRALGFICAPVLFQRVVETCVGLSTDVEAYARNRELLCGILDDLGYDYIEPDGAFYLWVKALEDDSQSFVDKARSHDLLLVQSDCFGVPGWARAGYCVSADTIANSRKAWAALKADYE